MADSGITFAPMQSEHLPLMRHWLEQPHWRAWWGEVEEEIAHVADMIEGRDSTEPYLIIHNGAPIGYIQVWRLGDYQNAEWIATNPWLMEFAPNTVGVDLSIGDASNLSRGRGSTALRAFALGLAEGGHRDIIIDPNPENERAIRAYARAGFRAIPHLEGKTPGVLLMRFELSEQTPASKVALS